MGFPGYPRPDGSFGVRNEVAVVSSVSCANGVVAAIARALPAVKPITHTEGCGRGLRDLPVTTRTLIGAGKNPNVAAALVVGLGCELVQARMIAEGIAASGKPVECLVIQEEGGSRKTTLKGIEIARRLLGHARTLERQEAGWERLKLGLKCGGSDTFSGVTANPMVGRAADWIVAEGGTAILSETTEMIGAEAALAKQCEGTDVRERVLALVADQRRRTKELLGPMADLVVSPGNMEGGLSSIQEKSLGCVAKAGSSPIREVVAYAETPSQRGLVIMDTPGSDIFSISGMAAGGAQVILFTTGRGTPAGCPIAPVIKVASTTRLFESMRDDMDVNAGRILEGLSLEEASEELIDHLKRVVAGERTKAEENLQDLFAIHTMEPAF